ncbi:MAG: site-2 protease family protein [Deltaproteobacteria bacterium]|nr:site-2 protease family protein [Nannocystaceae bacterium]
MFSPLVTAIHPEMLVALLGIGADRLRYTLIYVVCLVLAVSVHEFSHAFAAHKLGDPTPEGQGRLTLNPVAHADPIGTLALPVVLGLLSNGSMMFGWGRPVNTNPRFYTRKITMRAGMALVSIAGPLSNLLMALASLALTAVLAHGFGLGNWLVSKDNPLLMFFALNVLLFVFNLLPLHPLDGGKVLGWALGAKHQHIDEYLQRYGGIVLLVLVFAAPQVLGYLFAPFLGLAYWAFAAVVV